MTEGQYKKAIEIHNKLESLHSIEDKLANEKCCLMYGDELSTGGLVPFNTPIKDILTRHEAMIRQEIYDEIQKLKDEIKAI